MKTNAARQRDAKSRRAQGERAAEQLAKEARAARSKWNKPERARKREYLDEVSNHDRGDENELATHVLRDGVWHALPTSVTWRN